MHHPGDNSLVAAPNLERIFSRLALFTCLWKRDAFGKSLRQLTTARLKSDCGSRGDFEGTWAGELENFIFPAFLGFSKRESRA
jgi:hypothetical protein